jgi:NADH-ubiquinone oxidoreductase chain 6
MLVVVPLITLNYYYFKIITLHWVHRLLLLVSLFLLTALVYMLLDFYFVGLAYIIVYCGAIAIILLFVIMMVSFQSFQSFQSNNSLSLSLRQQQRSMTLSLYLSYLLLVLLVLVVLALSYFIDMLLAVKLVKLVKYFFTVYAYVYPINLIQSTLNLLITDLFTLGLTIYVNYFIALLLIAISLWIVMVGIISLVSSIVSLYLNI